MDFNSVSSKIESSDSLDFGSIFNRSFELFKKVWLQGFVIVLLSIVVILPIYAIMYIPMLMFGVEDIDNIDARELGPAFVGIAAILYLIILVLVVAVTTALNAAFLRICKQQDLEGASQDQYFYYFKKPFFIKLFKLSLISLGLAILGMLACGIGIIYMVVPLSLMPAFFAFNEKMEPKEIVKSSFNLGNKNWLVIFGLIFLMGIIAELGIILCFVGVFFTAMLARIPVYFMYKDAVGFSEEN